MNFAASILPWADARPRNLPWKDTRDPYRIWVSEVILQQTRVQQALGYYQRFLEAFPTVEALAAAPEDEVLKVWQGLGYYSRARNLRTTAQALVSEYGGRFPRTAAELLRLKGIGPYTAAAVASFAYGEQVPALDGNAHRVLARCFGIELPLDTVAGRKAYYALALELIPPGMSAAFNQAVMDLGAQVCTPRPHCGDCPLQEGCFALAHAATDRLPVKRPKPTPRLRNFLYLDLCCRDLGCLRKRPAGDIWQGLYDFPLIEETGEPLRPADLAGEPLVQALTGGQPFRVEETGRAYTHVLTHQRIQARFVRLEVEAPGQAPWPLPQDHLWLRRQDLETYPLPRLAERYVHSLTHLPQAEGGCSA